MRGVGLNATRTAFLGVLLRMGAQVRAEGRSDEQIVDLMAFAAIMLATNVFNNALEVPLDHVLEPFRRGGPHGSV